jgi:hypothetical protein
MPTSSTASGRAEGPHRQETKAPLKLTMQHNLFSATGGSALLLATCISSSLGSGYAAQDDEADSLGFIVLDDETGLPLGGVVAILMKEGGGPGSGEVHLGGKADQGEWTMTPVSGRLEFALPAHSTGSWELTIKGAAIGYRDYRGAVRLDAVGPTEIRLGELPELTLPGVLTDRLSGAAIANGSLHVLKEQSEAGGLDGIFGPTAFAGLLRGAEFMVSSEKDGTFVVGMPARRVAAQEYLITAPRYAAGILTVDRQHASCVATLRRSAAVYGRMLDPEGLPAKGLEVQVLVAAPDYWSSKRGLRAGDLAYVGIVDRDGWFRIGGLPSAVSLNLMYKVKGFPVTRSLTLKAGEVRDVGNSVPEVSDLAGFVQKEAGPGARLFVAAWTANSSDSEPWAYIDAGIEPPLVMVRTDAEGRFLVPNIPSGPLLLGVIRRKTAAGPVIAQRVFSPGTAYLRLRTGDSRVFITGVALDASGKGLAGVDILAFSPGVAGYVSGRSAADGGFRIGPVVPRQHFVYGQVEGAIDDTGKASDIHLRSQAVGWSEGKGDGLILRLQRVQPPRSTPPPSDK